MFHKKLIMNAMRARVLLIPWLLFAMALFTLKDREALGSEQKKPEQHSHTNPARRVSCITGFSPHSGEAPGMR